MNVRDCSVGFSMPIPFQSITISTKKIMYLKVGNNQLSQRTLELHPQKRTFSSHTYLKPEFKYVI